MFKFGNVSRIYNNEVEVTFVDDDTTGLIPIVDNGYKYKINDYVVVLFNDENQAVCIGKVM